MKDHKPNNFKQICVRVIFVTQNFWDCGGFWCIVQAFMPLCMGKKNEKYHFISISMFFVTYTHIDRHVYTTLWSLFGRESWPRLYNTGVGWQGYFHVHCCALPVRPAAKCSCKTTDFLPLFFLNAPLSFLSFRSLCGASFDFTLLAWILPSFSWLHPFLKLICLLFGKATEIWQLAEEWSGTLETCSNLSLSSTYFALCSYESVKPLSSELLMLNGIISSEDKMHCYTELFS